MSFIQLILWICLFTFIILLFTACLAAGVYRGISQAIHDNKVELASIIFVGLEMCKKKVSEDVVTDVINKIFEEEKE